MASDDSYVTSLVNRLLTGARCHWVFVHVTALFQTPGFQTLFFLYRLTHQPVFSSNSILRFHVVKYLIFVLTMEVTPHHDAIEVISYSIHINNNPV